MQQVWIRMPKGSRSGDQNHKTKVTHQDIAIHRETGGPERNKYYCTLYDRKEDKEYKPLRPHMVLCSPIDTNLSEECLYGVMYTHARRSVLRSSRYDHCLEAIKHYLDRFIKAGYSKCRLFLRVGKLLSKPQFRHQYGINSGRKMLATLRQQYRV